MHSTNLAKVREAQRNKIRVLLCFYFAKQSITQRDARISRRDRLVRTHDEQHRELGYLRVILRVASRVQDYEGTLPAVADTTSCGGGRERVPPARVWQGHVYGCCKSR